jgi:hypothetical protein
MSSARLHLASDTTQYRRIRGMFQHIARFSNGQKVDRYSYGRRLLALRFRASIPPEGGT